MPIRPKYFPFMDRTHSSLGIFSTDSGITLSFGPNTYFIDAADPFHNIACKALELEDYIPRMLKLPKGKE